MKKTGLLSLTTLTLCLGCSTLDSAKTRFEDWQNNIVDRRTFQIRKDWVRQGTENLNLAYRKINRMTPLMYTNKKVGTLVIVGNAIDGLVAMDAVTGTEFWRLPVLNGVEGSATLIQNKIFFGGNDGQFYSADATTGKILWTFPTRIENLSEPLVEDGIVYFLTGSNSLYALDAVTGKQLWLYSRQDPSALSVRGGSRPTLRNGVLFVGFSDGYLAAIFSKNGQVKWEKQLNRNKKFKDIDTNPVIDGEFLYALGFDDKLYCLRSSTGDAVWTSEKGGFGGLLISGDKLFYPTTSSELLAVDKSTGNKIWSYSLKEGIATTPVLYRGLITFGESQGELVFLDTGTGKFVGSFNPGKGILSTPAVDEKNNRVYFISGEANIYALDVGFKYPNAIPYLR